MKRSSSKIEFTHFDEIIITTKWKYKNLPNLKRNIYGHTKPS
jgi:hypothetical protein